jgi:hypothetical protein
MIWRVDGGWVKEVGLHQPNRGVGSTHLCLFLAPSTAVVAASLCDAFGAENVAAETAVVSSDGCAEFSAASLWHKGLRATLGG